MLEIGTSVGRMLTPAPAPRRRSRGGIAFRDPNECLYQFVSIVFEYFCAFVTILIPCGCGFRIDVFCLIFHLFVLIWSPFDRPPFVCWLKALGELLGLISCSPSRYLSQNLSANILWYIALIGSGVSIIPASWMYVIYSSKASALTESGTVYLKNAN